MKDLVVFLAKSLVDHPEDVVVLENDNGKTVVLSLKTHPDDVGKVIGKHGKNAKAIRTVVKAMGARANKKVLVEIDK